MLNKFITVLIIEISKFLTNNKNFFQAETVQKEKLLAEVKIPNAVKTYLSKTTEAEFLNELHQLVKHLNSNPVQLEENNLAKSIANFLVTNFANDIYSLPSSYFKLIYSDQKEITNKMISSNSELATSLKQILTDYSYQEILNGIQDFTSKSIKTPLIIVQSPVEIEPETKKEIKEYLSQDLQVPCLPIFQINKSLIGGLRLFINGKVSDLSWIKRINLITSL